jgi:hypothetical protein
MKTEQWVLFRYTDENGKIICEKWAEVSNLLSGVEAIDREMEQSLGKVFRPKISCEAVKRQAERPTS